MLNFIKDIYDGVRHRGILSYEGWIAFVAVMFLLTVVLTFLWGPSASRIVMLFQSGAFLGYAGYRFDAGKPFLSFNDSVGHWGLALLAGVLFGLGVFGGYPMFWADILFGLIFIMFGFGDSIVDWIKTRL